METIADLRARAWDVLSSLKLAIACMVVLMALVVACTLAQVELGTWRAVDLYIRSFVVWWTVPGAGWRIPVFPGGATVGLVLGANLVAAQWRRFRWSARKAGLWLVHAGLILLFVGEFVTGAFQVETQLSVEEGQTVSYVEDLREVELAVTETTDPAFDEVHAIPESLLAGESDVPLPGTPLTIRVVRYVREAPPPSPEELLDLRTAWVEARAGDRSLGAWRVSNTVAGAHAFTDAGRTWTIGMRPRREHLPFRVTLADFRHELHPGTDIPRTFSSLLHLSHPERGEERDVLVSMNQPLRYGGKAFYQASFGKGDTLSVLQVVENPGWLIPYVSCVLVTLGLVIHFSISLRRSARRPRATMQEAG